MSSSSSLTCNFTIETSLDIGVSFQSDYGGASWGGQITIFTPYTAGPVTTGLWDSDGNVFFNIHSSENPSLSCMINSGSNPGSWDPYVVVAQESGLACTISGPEPTGPDTYNYTLSVSLSSAGGTGETKDTAGTTAPPAPQHVARMVLPAGGTGETKDTAGTTAPPAGETYLLEVVETQPEESFMATNYTFSVSLLDASANPNELQVWQSGTLTLDTSSLPSVTGALTLPGYFKEPIPFSGSVMPPDTLAGQTITASGQSSEAEITFNIVYNYDGFLYEGSYLGGLMSMLDNNAEETFLYAMQGLSPQGPFGATFRGSPGSSDKRKPKSS